MSSQEESWWLKWLHSNLFCFRVKNHQIMYKFKKKVKNGKKVFWPAFMCVQHLKAGANIQHIFFNHFYAPLLGLFWNTSRGKTDTKSTDCLSKSYLLQNIFLFVRFSGKHKNNVTPWKTGFQTKLITGPFCFEQEIVMNLSSLDKNNTVKAI